MHLSCGAGGCTLGLWVPARRAPAFFPLLALPHGRPGPPERRTKRAPWAPSLPCACCLLESASLSDRFLSELGVSGGTVSHLGPCSYPRACRAVVGSSKLPQTATAVRRPYRMIFVICKAWALCQACPVIMQSLGIMRRLVSKSLSSRANIIYVAVRAPARRYGPSPVFARPSAPMAAAAFVDPARVWQGDHNAAGRPTRARCAYEAPSDQLRTESACEKDSGPIFHRAGRCAVQRGVRASGYSRQILTHNLGGTTCLMLLV